LQKESPWRMCRRCRARWDERERETEHFCVRSWWSLEAACKIYAYLEHWFDLSDGVGQGDAALGRILCVSLRRTGPLETPFSNKVK
jgi:hypothetical protein